MREHFRDLRKGIAAVAKWFGVAAAVLVLLLGAPAALGAPRAHNAAECRLAADMAVVARALAEEGVERAKALSLMQRIYLVEPSGSGGELMQAILEVAYRGDEPAGVFASNLLVVCMATGGDMDRILGARL